MIIENKTTEVGDVLHISTDVPVLGFVLLSGFVDSISSDSTDIFFQKKFRYSKDVGSTWSDWVDLTNENLRAIPITEKGMYLFEYAYQHAGKDGVLYFNWVQLNGEVETGADTIYKKTDFSKFFSVNDINVLGWAFNVLEKLYEQGILPRYIQRNYSEDSGDFISYWLSVTHFFAIIVYMARQFEHIKSNDILFNLFLESRGIILTGNETSVQKDYLFSNYVDEYRKRGTNAIINVGEVVNGEFLRLIDYNQDDEFMFFNLVRQDLGWCLDFSSPMWNRLEQVVNSVKAYEKTNDPSIIDETKYPFVGGSIKKDYQKQNWFAFDTTDGAVSGIDIEIPSKENLLKISPATSYEISFAVQAVGSESSLDSYNDNLYFGVKGYANEENGSLVQLDCTNLVSGETSNSFFSIDTPRFIYKTDQVYLIRGIIFSADTTVDDSRALNFLNGVPLRFHKDMKFMTPVITQTFGNQTKTLIINNIKVRPLQLPVERGYLGTVYPIVSYFYNNGGRSEDYIKSFTEQYLLNYKNNILLPTYLKEVDVKFVSFTVDWVPVEGGTVTGAVTDVPAGTVADMNIYPAVGYKIASVTKNGELLPAPYVNYYRWVLDDNVHCEVTFAKVSLFFVTSGRNVSLTGSKYTGDIVIDWGDDIVTTNVLTHTYRDTNLRHTVTLLDGVLTELICSNSSVEEITFYETPALTKVDLSSNKINSLDITTLVNLTDLNVRSNNLAYIDLSKNVNVTTLDVGSNKLNTLTLNTLTKLVTLKAGTNNISFIDLSANTSLEYIDLSTNKLTTFTYNSTLTRYIDLSANAIKSQPSFVSAPVLEVLLMNNTQVSTISFDSTYAKLREIELQYCLLLTDFTADGLPVLASINFTGDNSITNLTINNCKSLTTLKYTSEASARIVFTNNDFASVPFSLSQMTKLTYLDINHNRISNIGVIPVSVSYLDISFNEFTVQPQLKSGSKLVTFKANDNNITAFDVTPALSLEYFDFSENMGGSDIAVNGNVIPSTKIVTLIFDSTPISTVTLNNKSALALFSAKGCEDLVSVDLRSNASLTEAYFDGDVRLNTVNISNCSLTTLILQGCTSLVSIDASYNQLQALDLSTNTVLTNVNVDSNLLATLDVSMLTKLVVLSVNENKLANLDVSKCILLNKLLCRANLLTTLDTTGLNKLNTLDCSSNKITDSSKLILSPVLVTFIGNNNKFGSFEIDSHPSIETIDISENTPLTIVTVHACTKLNELDIHNCTGSTDISITNCIALTNLNIVGDSALVNLTVSGNTALVNLVATELTALVNATLNGNALTSFTPTDSINLQVLEISDNKLTTLDITSNVLITSIKANNNKLSSILTADNSGLNVNIFGSHYGELTFISLNGNLLSMMAVTSPKVKELYVNDNELIAIMFYAIVSGSDVEYSPLEVIHCDNNNLSAENIALGIGYLTGTLITFSANNNLSYIFPVNDMTGAVSGYSGDFSYLKLENLYLNSTATDYLNMAYLPALTNLYMSNSKLDNIDYTAKGSSEITKTPLLNLDISYTPILLKADSVTPVFVKLLTKTPDLKFLDISGWNTLSAFDFGNANLQKLETLYIKKAAVLGQTSFTNLPMLKELNIEEGNLVPLLTWGAASIFDGTVNLAKMIYSKGALYMKVNTDTVTAWESLSGRIVKVDGFSLALLSSNLDSYERFLIGSGDSIEYSIGKCAGKDGMLYYGSNDLLIGDEPLDPDRKTRVVNKLVENGWTLERVEEQPVSRVSLLSINPSGTSINLPRTYYSTSNNELNVSSLEGFSAVFDKAITGVRAIWSDESNIFASVLKFNISTTTTNNDTLTITGGTNISNFRDGAYDFARIDTGKDLSFEMTFEGVSEKFIFTVKGDYVLTPSMTYQDPNQGTIIVDQVIPRDTHYDSDENVFKHYFPVKRSNPIGWQSFLVNFGFATDILVGNSSVVYSQVGWQLESRRGPTGNENNMLSLYWSAKSTTDDQTSESDFYIQYKNGCVIKGTILFKR